MNKKRNEWFIHDQEVINAIRANGFYCERSTMGPVSGNTQIATGGGNITQIIRASGGSENFFETDLPIEWNGSFTLPDGRTIISKGTRLAFGEEKLHQSATGK